MWSLFPEREKQKIKQGMSIRNLVGKTSWDIDHWPSLMSKVKGREGQSAECGRNFIYSGTKAPVTLALFVFVICVLKKIAEYFLFLFCLASYSSYGFLGVFWKHLLSCWEEIYSKKEKERFFLWKRKMQKITKDSVIKYPLVIIKNFGRNSFFQAKVRFFGTCRYNRLLHLIAALWNHARKNSLHLIFENLLTSKNKNNKTRFRWKLLHRPIFRNLSLETFVYQ